VKPGILGWSQCHLEETGGVPDEALRLEYDFYYIRQESPSLDLDILQRKLFGRRVTRRPAAAPGAADEA
jgi:lipopolysaccharide/colanic/teichoic acid biosynthesis glycosyltransferase